MKTLLFKNNVHNTDKVEIPGEDEPRAINLTVRKGLKWSDLRVGDTIWLQVTPIDPTTVSPESKTAPISHQLAIIYDVKVMTFNDLMNYPRMLQLEHDPECQNYKGLFEVMRRVYDGFLQHELVTLVFYEIIQETPGS